MAAWLARTWRPRLAARILIPLMVIGMLAGGPIVHGSSVHGGGISALRLRKDVKDLTPQERRDFVDAILAMKHTPSPWNPHLSYYDQFVYWHVRAFACGIDAAHMHPSFLPWHRMFLLLFENALRQVSGKNITVPYWDWTDPASTAAVFRDDFMGGNGNPAQRYALTTGPFRRGTWRLNVVDQETEFIPQPGGTLEPKVPYIVRAFGSFVRVPRLPTAAQVRQVMRVPTYDVPPYDVTSDPSRSFRNALEGWRGKTGMACKNGTMDVLGKGKPSELHNAVHLWVGGITGNDKRPIEGTMTLNSSPDDPVFFLHHANIDRLWTEWETIHGQVYAPVSGAARGQNLDDSMWPYRTIGINTTIAQTLNERNFGYVYASELGGK